MTCVRAIRRGRGRFVADEAGASTVWSIFWTVIFLLMAGLVIDTSNAYRFKNILQATADSGASTALMAYQDLRYAGRYWHDDEAYYLPGNAAPKDGEARADEMAVDVTKRIMGTARNGTVTTASMVEMGNWDGSKFTAGVSPINAAQVRSERTERNDNRLDTLLLGAFDGLDFWDVGAVSVAHVFEGDCPSGEAIMAGNTLNLASNNYIIGEICLHGEEKADLNNNNVFAANPAGKPGLSYGANGKVCKGLGNCSTEDFSHVTSNNTGLTDDMIGQSLVMPDVEVMIASIEQTITDPESAVADPTFDQFLPQALVSNQFRDIGVAAQLQLYQSVAFDGASAIKLNVNGTTSTVPLPAGADATILSSTGANGVLELTMKKKEFTDALDAVETTGVGLPANAIYRVTGCNGKGGAALKLDQAVTVSDIVLHTACSIDFGGDFTLSNSTVFTTFDGGNAAIGGSADATLGTATCVDNSPGGSTLVSAGSDINFAAKLNLNGSELILPATFISLPGQWLRRSKHLRRQRRVHHVQRHLPGLPEPGEPQPHHHAQLQAGALSVPASG